MRLALYVHDFRLQVGHSNSLIELVRHLPTNLLDQIEEIEVVSHVATPLPELFPNFKGKLTWTKAPFENVSPFLLKSILYQVWTFFYNRFSQKKNTYRIGIGICCLDVNAVSVQFIHHQWTKKGLEMESGHFLRLTYKKIFFKYLESCENFLFQKKNIRLFSPAKFMTYFLRNKYPELQTTTIYSGINLDRFNLSQKEKKDIHYDLSEKYPVLKDLDINRPIYLFVGAYERKGAQEALDLVAKLEDAQFILIGSPSLGRHLRFPRGLRVFPIKFSREIDQFYALSDTFVFPTLYEPFGLVLFEAMAMGLTIITNYHEVGASELLKGLPEVYFQDESSFSFPPAKVKSIEEKRNLRELRLKQLQDTSWKKAAQELSSFLEF